MMILILSSPFVLYLTCLSQ